MEESERKEGLIDHTNLRLPPYLSVMIIIMTRLGQEARARSWREAMWVIKPPFRKRECMKVVMFSFFPSFVNLDFSILKFISHVFLILLLMAPCGHKIFTTPGPSRSAQEIMDVLYFYHDFFPKEDQEKMRALEAEVGLVQ
jgi:hypothetical protein